MWKIQSTFAVWLGGMWHRCDDLSNHPLHEVRVRNPAQSMVWDGILDTQGEEDPEAAGLPIPSEYLDQYHTSINFLTLHILRRFVLFMRGV